MACTFRLLTNTLPPDFFHHPIGTLATTTTLLKLKFNEQIVSISHQANPGIDDKAFQKRHDQIAKDL